MTPKQKRFVQEYLIDLNATQAAIRAGYSSKRADAIGYENLRKPEIRSALEKAQERLAEEAGIAAAQVLRELAIMGLSDLTDYVVWGPDGVSLKDSASLDAAKRRAVVEVSQTQHGVKIKLANKLGALELIGRHLGLFEKPETRDDDDARGYIVVLPPKAESIDAWAAKYSQQPTQH